MPVPIPETGQVSIDDFKNHTRNCGVKKVQREFEEISKTAKANNRSAVAEMKAQGFKDFNSFQKACDRFDYKCKATEFSELGSGYVLYFHFLAALACILLAIWVLQIPAMILYGAESQQCTWHGLNSNSWENAYDVKLGAFPLPNPNCTGAETVSRWQMSPGNLGPNQATSGLIPTFYTVCLVIICFIILISYQEFALTDKLVDATTTSPADFAVQLSNLPVTATNEAQIRDWCRKNLVRDQEDTEIVKVVIGWSNEQFREKCSKMMALKKQAMELPPKDPQIKSLLEQYKAIAAELNSIGTDAARLQSSGVVVVVLRYQKDQMACIERWNHTFATWMYRDSNPLCLWFRCPGNPLPLFPVGDEAPTYKIKVDQAAEPGDIIWEYLGVPLLERLKKLAQTWGAMFLIILVSFILIWLLVKAQESAESHEGTSWLSFLPSILIAMTNMGITIVSTILGKYEFHNTETEKDFSLALKMTLGMIVNTGGIIFFCRAQPKEWYTNGSLVSEVFTMLFFTSMTSPFVNAIDLKYKMAGIYRPWGCSSRKITEAKCNELNEVIQRVAPKKEKTKEEQEEIKEVTNQVNFWKSKYEPSSMRQPRCYANALKTFMASVLYSPLLPNAALIGLVGIVLQYAMDKYLLLRWYKRPERPANARMALFSMTFIKYCTPIGLAVTVFLFTTPSWENKEVCWSNFYMSLAIACLFSFFVPLGFWQRFLCCFTKQLADITDTTEQDYYKAQFMWDKQMFYHKDQFLYKKLPEEKNPTFLKPGMDSATNMADLQSGLGKGAAAMAEGGGGSRGVRLRGGLCTSESSGHLGGGQYGVPNVTSANSSGSWAAGPVKASPAPVVPCPAPAPVEEETAPEPEADVVLPGTVDEEATPEGNVVWEFENNHGGWNKYDNDCQDYLERSYQRYKNDGGRECVNVKTSGITLSISYGRMSQKKEHKIRKIRREVNA